MAQGVSRLDVDVVVLGGGVAAAWAASLLGRLHRVAWLESSEAHIEAPFLALVGEPREWLNMIPGLASALGDAAPVDSLAICDRGGARHLPLAGAWATSARGALYPAGALWRALDALPTPSSTRRVRCRGPIAFTSGGGVEGDSDEGAFVATGRELLDLRAAASGAGRAISLQRAIWRPASPGPPIQIAQAAIQGGCLWVHPLPDGRVGLCVVRATPGAVEALLPTLRALPDVGQRFADGAWESRAATEIAPPPPAAPAPGVAFSAQRISRPLETADAWPIATIYAATLAARCVQMALDDPARRAQAQGIFAATQRAMALDDHAAAQARRAMLGLEPSALSSPERRALQGALDRQERALPLARRLAGGRLVVAVPTPDAGLRPTWFASLRPRLAMNLGVGPDDLAGLDAVSAAYCEAAAPGEAHRLRLQQARILAGAPAAPGGPPRGIVASALEGSAQLALGYDSEVVLQEFEEAFRILPYLLRVELGEPSLESLRWLDAASLGRLDDWAPGESLEGAIAPGDAGLIESLVVGGHLSVESVAPAARDQPLSGADRERLAAAVGDLAEAPERALGQIAALHRLYPLRRDVRYELAMALRRLDRREQALGVVAPALQGEWPADEIAEPLAALGIGLLDEMGRSAQALPIYQRALAAGLDGIPLHLTAALAFRGRPVASQVLDEVLRREPLHVRAHALAALEAARPATAILHAIAYEMLAPPSHPLREAIRGRVDEALRAAAGARAGDDLETGVEGVIAASQGASAEQIEAVVHALAAADPSTQPIPWRSRLILLARQVRDQGIASTLAGALGRWPEIPPGPPAARRPLRHRCRGCGRSCDGQFVGSLDDAFLRALPEMAAELATLHPELAGVEPVRVLDPDGMAIPILAARPDGRCVFLSPERRCRIQERFGAERKPMACREFPYARVETEAGVRHGVQPICYQAHEGFERDPERSPAELMGGPVLPTAAPLRLSPALLRASPRAPSLSELGASELGVEALEDALLDLLGRPGCRAVDVLAFACWALTGRRPDPDALLSGAPAAAIGARLARFARALADRVADDPPPGTHAEAVHRLAGDIAGGPERPLRPLAPGDRRFGIAALGEHFFLRGWYHSQSLGCDLVGLSLGLLAAAQCARVRGAPEGERPSEPFAHALTAWIRVNRTGRFTLLFTDEDELLRFVRELVEPS